MDKEFVPAARDFYFSHLLLGCAKQMYDNVRSIAIVSGDVYEHIATDEGVSISSINHLST